MRKFSMDPSFNRSKFITDIQKALLAPVNLTPEDEYLNDKGLRYIIQAPVLMNVQEVQDLVQKFLYEKFVVEQLFDVNENNPIPEKLQGFFLASIRGVSFKSLTQSPFDAAYSLLAKTPFISVEPDLPYFRFIGLPKKSIKTSPTPLDRAWSLRNMRVDKAWNIQPTAGLKDGEGITIAHLDTGWTDHNDLDFINFDLNRAKDFIEPKSNAEDPLTYPGNPGHGTKTGSVIMSGGGVGVSDTIPSGEVTGVARKVTYVPIRCIKSVVIIFNSDVAKAITYATVSKCDVISMSLGGRPMKAMQVALENATDNDVIVLNAAGNNVRVVVWPARYPQAIAVAGSNHLDLPWNGSSRGQRVDISAPGEGVYVAEPGPSKRKVVPGNGTSYATANMAGVAALWLAFHQKTQLQKVARNSGVNLQQLFRYAIKSTARQPSHGWDTKKFGAGIVQVDNLLKLSLKSLQLFRNKQNIRYKEAYMINDDEFSTLVRKTFKHPKLSPNKFLELFGNEISGLILDLLEDAQSSIDAELISKEKLIFYLKKNGSMTLQKTLNLNSKLLNF